MQQKFWNDTGLASDGGEISSTLLPTPNSQPSARKLTDGKSVAANGERWGMSILQLARDCPERISSVADSPASLYQWQAVGKGLVMNAGCGSRFAKLSTLSNPAGFWLRTCQDSVQQNMAGFSGEYCETWPKWGILRNGEAFQAVRPLISRIKESECSLLPTPTDASKGGGTSRSGDRINETPTLQGMARKGMMPTPNTMDHLPGQANLEARKQKGGCSNLKDRLPIGGLLNPQFVEAIMGFPVGWTDLDASETP